MVAYSSKNGVSYARAITRRLKKGLRVVPQLQCSSKETLRFRKHSGEDVFMIRSLTVHVARIE